MVAKSLIESLASFDAGAVITKALAASAPKLITVAANQIKKTPERISTALGLGFTNHLQTTYDKCYKIKTLIYREEPVELLSQYVSIKLGLKKAKFTDNYIIENLESYKNVIVQGSGGSGKTMFMKYLSLCRFENPRGRIPLFIELRTLDYNNGKPIEELIFEDSTSKKSRMTFEQFDTALAGGLFLIILDGLDEVDPSRREQIHKQIIKMPIKYPENILVISSREDPSLKGWNQFYTFSVLPLDKKQVTSVIRKIDFDKTIKDKFLKDLNSNLYDRHRSFLTNPLLATIMLLRYDQFADAGDKIYIFYDQAFETLFFKHDLSKGVYERKRYTTVSVDEFKRFFSAFCFTTYAKNKYSFMRSEMVSFIDRALKYCVIEASPALVLKDLLESVCIIQEDGLLFTFVHRSFQEYFAALFVSNYRGDRIAEYTEIVMSRSRTETAGPILMEMAPELVNKVWALPLLESCVQQICSIDVEVTPGEVLALLSSSIVLEKDWSVNGFAVDSLGSKILNIERYYSVDLSPWLTSHLFFNNREEFQGIRSKLSVENKERFRKLTSSAAAEDTFYYSISKDDDYWLIHTKATAILKDVQESLREGLRMIEDLTARFAAADDDLL